jgi:hypothetical protein
VPQLTDRELPQLSAAVMYPHVWPTRTQKAASLSGEQRTQNAASLSFVQPHTFGTPEFPPPQVWPAPAQVVPQLTVRFAPQLSVLVRLPQFFPSRVHMVASVSGVQQLLGCEAVGGSQTCAPLQTPQLLVRSLPQLSAAVTVPQA